ncbi:MAG: delta-60 repeat domain-containing protein, partial [Candidatus Thiodiazotropha sp.]
RYTSSGILDTTFGGGIVTTSIGIGNTSVASIAVQSDGKVLIAGTSSNKLTNEDFTIVRYAADGSLDNSFGSGGVLISPLSLDYDYARAIALQPDGKIVVAGTARDGSIDDFALMRIDSDGTLDTTFGNNGHVLTQVGNGNAYARALALQPDGKILTAGLTLGAYSHQYDNEFVLARYTTSGDLDTSFNNSGLLYMPYGLDREYSLALQADGKVLTAGIMSEVANAEFSLSRFLLKDDNDDGIAEAWDLTPDAFTFTDVTDVAPDSLQTSNLITISGLEAGVYVPLQIVNGEYALSGSTTYSNAPAWVHNDEQINVRHTSAAGAGLSIHTTLTVGGLRSLNNQALIVGAVTIDTFTSTTAPVDNSPSNGSSDSSGGGGAFSFLLLFVLCFFAFASRRHKAKTGQFWPLLSIDSIKPPSEQKIHKSTDCHRHVVTLEVAKLWSLWGFCGSLDRERKRSTA